MSDVVVIPVGTRTVGGFDNGPCALCARDEPCSCAPGNCQCECGRCCYPFPLPDDGPHYRRDRGWPT